MDMVRIANEGHQDLDLKTGHVVPAGGDLVLEKAVWLNVRQWALTGGKIIEKEIGDGPEVQLRPDAGDSVEIAVAIRPDGDADPKPARVKKSKAKRPRKGDED